MLKATANEPWVRDHPEGAKAEQAGREMRIASLDAGRVGKSQGMAHRANAHRVIVGVHGLQAPAEWMAESAGTAIAGAHARIFANPTRSLRRSSASAPGPAERCAVMDGSRGARASGARGRLTN